MRRLMLQLALVATSLAACSSAAPATPTRLAAATPVSTTSPIPVVVATAEPPGPPSSSVAASPAGPAMLPILVSTELAPGLNRFLFSLADRLNRLLAAPDVTVGLQFYDDDVDPEAVAFEADARFLWAVEGVNGLYAADIELPNAGRWGTRFNATFPDGSTQTVRADYDILDAPVTPAIGGAAPSVDTPTAVDVGGRLARVTTDPDPEPRFYERSIADALAAKEPFVVVFATPAFCESATCGPTLETVKAVAAERPDLTFINVEPYVMEERDGRLQPVLDAQGQLQAAAWTEAWSLLTEPFVAVVDADGNVQAKFESAIAADELLAAIDRL